MNEILKLMRNSKDIFNQWREEQKDFSRLVDSDSYLAIRIKSLVKPVFSIGETKFLYSETIYSVSILAIFPDMSVGSASIGPFNGLSHEIGGDRSILEYIASNPNRIVYGKDV